MKTTLNVVHIYKLHRVAMLIQMILVKLLLET